MSLVNDSLKFQMAILQIHCYFWLKKCENPLHLFAYVIDIYLMSGGLNDDVKLVKFSTTGPWFSDEAAHFRFCLSNSTKR